MWYQVFETGTQRREYYKGWLVAQYYAMVMRFQNRFRHRVYVIEEYGGYYI